MTSLPKHIDEFDFRKTLSLASHHIVDLQTQKDNITGFCTGKGRVQVRCSDDPHRAVDHIIESLASKGVTAQVKSHKRVKEIVDITNEVLRQARKRTLPQKEDPLLLGLTSPKPLIGSKKMLDAPPFTVNDLSMRPPIDYQAVKTAIISNSNDFSSVNNDENRYPDGTF